MDVCVDCGMRAVGECQACHRLFCGAHLTRTGRAFNEYEMQDHLIDNRLALPREPRDDEVVDYLAANRILLSDHRALCLYHCAALIFLNERTFYRHVTPPTVPPKAAHSH